ncbi:hypothetical protein CICLE_v10013280mg [Citrus x clementina]|uniref:Ribosomal protein/NADH dehydrogenase domain-containing protein n=1 Tax=Citrus clementina TaxID=85681 RepID=V4SRU3_CITCL|nr:hypothetical protein CICLE_v10013280mg [Citrus x clementina]
MISCIASEILIKTICWFEYLYIIGLHLCMLYKDLKTLNPKLHILIRQCIEVKPQLWARNGISTLSALFF